MDTNYQLVNSVDPSKCRTKIRDKFAKLTLSSNKKRQEDAEMQQQIRENAALSNVSRNLINDLFTDDESDDEKPEEQPTENLLMRTDSSPSDDNLAARKSSRQSINTTHCTEAEESSVMEPLHVSETDNTQAQENIENVIETLSSKVSMLTVESPMTMSSFGSAHNNSHVSLVVSTENQRMNAGPKAAEVTLTPKATDHEEDSICISSDTEDSVITISDSSKSDEEFEVNVTPSCNSLSHNTLVAVKEERMARFLHDVKRNYGLAVTPERDFEDRCRQIATADTEPMSSEIASQSIGAARRIATAETESMSACEEFTAADREEAVQNTSKANLAAADTEDMTKASETMMSSPGYEPVMKTGTELLDDSGKDSHESMPEDSLTIAETSVEEEEPENQSNDSQQALRESKSISHESKRSSSSSDQNSQFQINISAKINIKIQISQQQLQESMSSNSTEPSPPNNRSVRDTLEEQQHTSAQKAQIQPTAVEDIPHSPPERDVASELPKADEQSPDDFERAERLLNELYGTSWKTPEVLQSLKKTTVRRNLPKPPMKQAHPNPTDDSSLGEFSIFRQNIPLDSTRLIESPSTFKTPRAIGRCSRSVRRVEIKGEEEPLPLKTSNTQVIKTKSGRSVQQILASIVDSDSESDGVNASGGSNQSWKLSDEEDVENKSKPVTAPKRRKPKNNVSPQNDDDLVYLDLSKGEVEIQHNVSSSPPANNDANFNRRLEEILQSCKVKDKPKIESTPGGKPKRKLFTAQINDDDDFGPPPFDSPREKLQDLIGDDASVSLSGGPLPSIFEPFNKHLEAVKTGRPIFKIHTPKSKRDIPEPESPAPTTPKSVLKESRVVGDICLTPKDTYGFLKSLDLCVGKSFCHPDALYYRNNYRLKRDELAHKLYEIYNRKCFNGELDVPLRWNKKLTNTAGRCMNKKRLGERSCVVELSEKVLTSADRLRCTLIHELCHAATWIVNGEGGHGASWKAWARKANQIFPELPKIGVCHQYDIEYKYTYKCTLCAAKSHAHSKSKKVENIRCSYCHGAIEVYLNKKDKEGNIVATPVKEATGFAKFVKEKYKAYKKPELKHADVMKLLSSEFASMKMDAKA